MQSDIRPCPSPAVYREATRLLQALIAGGDMIPLPDGATRFAFECSEEFLDRLSLWLAASGSVEALAEPVAPPVRDESLPDTSAAIAAERDNSNVIAPAALLHAHSVRAGARVALARLHADQDGPLPELVLRSPMEAGAFRAERLTTAASSR